MPELSPDLRLVLIGYGAMGHAIEQVAPAHHCTVVDRFTRVRPFVSQTVCDVAIDFTHPLAVLDNIEAVLSTGVPMVVGTTGWLRDLEKVHAIVERTNGRLIYGSNFSVGVTVFLSIVRHAARLVGRFSYYDVALHELHHRRKMDSPSGTALNLAETILEHIPEKTRCLLETSHGRIDESALHVSSTRVGDTPGTHTVYFDSEADTIELTHRARSRSGFASGALVAARWLTSQAPGIYRFETDVVGVPSSE